MTTINEDELIEGVRKGDTHSCNLLVKTYWTELCFLARRFVNDADLANDVVQEALINAIRNIDKYERRGHFKAWLRKIVTNQALMALRKQKARKEESLDALMLEFDDSGHHMHPFKEQPASLEALEESKQAREQVRLAIGRLPDTYRITLILRDIEGYTGKEVADIMDTTEKNVKVRLHRARLALRNLLEPILREPK